MSWNIKRSRADLAHERMIHSKPWRKYATRYREAHPLCSVPGCYGDTAAVDHIVPPKGDRTLFWAKDNHRSLCRHHHASVTAQTMRGKAPRFKGCDANGNPVDPNHHWNKGVGRGCGSGPVALGPRWGSVARNVAKS